MVGNRLGTTRCMIRCAVGSEWVLVWLLSNLRSNHTKDASVRQCAAEFQEHVASSATQINASFIAST